MVYSFKDVLNTEVYENTRVMFVLGAYNWFNNMVCDTLKDMCVDQEDTMQYSNEIEEEFGIFDDKFSGASGSIVDFKTFMDVIGVASINGKWYCRTELSTLDKKQLEKLKKYINEPSDNGVLVITSLDWKDYRDILKWRALKSSSHSHIIQLSFPYKPILKKIVAMQFEDKDIIITSKAADTFLMKMSNAYDEYEGQIQEICRIHRGINTGQLELTDKELKVYMKGVEHFMIDDFVNELLKPLSSNKITSNIKIYRMMAALQENRSAKTLIYELLKKFNVYRDYRCLINGGYIPVGIHFFFKDVIESLPEKYKKQYENVPEWKFRKEAYIASLTSLRDWEYMIMILSKPLYNKRISDDVMEQKCQRALYEVCTRTILSEDRLNNIVGIDNVLSHGLDKINKTLYESGGKHEVKNE